MARPRPDPRVEPSSPQVLELFDERAAADAATDELNRRHQGKPFTAKIGKHELPVIARTMPTRNGRWAVYLLVEATYGPG